MYTIQLGPETWENKIKILLFNPFCVVIDYIWKFVGTTGEEARDEFIDRGSLTEETPTRFDNR